MKRKRSFYRALKRNETWALMQQCMKDISRAMYKTMYGSIILEENKFSGLLETIKEEKNE